MTNSTKSLTDTTDSDRLAHLVAEGAATRYPFPVTAELEARLNKELATIASIGATASLLTITEGAEAARNSGYLVGTGRGSSYGSILEYCLGITDINPIETEKLMTQFLESSLGESYPDIDTNFEHGKTDQTMDYLRERYVVPGI